MSKVKMPLHSISATGPFAGIMVYSTSSDQSIVKKLTNPSQPRTRLQIANREMFTYLAHNWQRMLLQDQESWLFEAQRRSISSFNAYFSENLKYWRDFGPPTANKIPYGTNPPLLGALTVTPAIRQLQYELEVITPNAMTGAFIMLDPKPIIDPVKKQLAKINLYAGTNPRGVLTPLKPGKYHLRAAGITIGGNISSYTPDQLVIVQ